MKCRTKREFEGQVVTLKNGRPAAQGTCPVCGTKVQRILGKDAGEGPRLVGLIERFSSSETSAGRGR